MRNKVKISGYTKKINYLGDISYRPYNTINNPIRYDSLFTSGNFSVIGSVADNTFKTYKGKEFSKYYTLQDMGVSIEEIKEIYSNDKLRLKLNPHDLTSYAYFGSLREYMRVTLENIIINFPAAIVIKPYNKLGDLTPGFDGEKLYLDNIENPFEINFREKSFDSQNVLRDLHQSYTNYVISDGKNSTEVTFIEDINSDDFIYLNVDDINKINTSSILYLKPNEKEVEKFFLNLNDLGKQLLNRDIFPKYTYQFNRKHFVEELGYYVEGFSKGTWPTSDGYNIDFDNGMYDEYVSELIELCDEQDYEVSNIIIRQLITTSILEFDTVPSYDIDNIVDDSQKIKTLLTLYGRSYDEQKKYIDNIKFSNVVTYDGINNTPDSVISTIANTFGWGMLNPTDENSLVKDLLTKDPLSKNEIGYELSKEEIKTEIFKRLIINSPWLYKSKGTRKALHFFNEFFNIPDGLVSFNEYVYRATNRIPFSDLRDINNETSIFKLYDEPQRYYTTDEGFPYIPSNSSDVYFQMAGRWHQVTTGPDTNLEINDGNNPHMGPYDGGQSYWGLYKNLLPDFQPVTVVKEENVVTSKNIYNETFEGFTIDQNVSERLFNVNEQQNFDVIGKIKTTYPPKQEYDICGCEVNNTTRTLDVSADKTENNFTCNYDLVQYNTNNTYSFYLKGNLVQPTLECCSGIGGEYTYSYTNKAYVCVSDGFYDCNRYTYSSTNDMAYEVFLDQSNGTYTTVVPSIECCTSEGTPFQTNGGYNCVRKFSIEGQCIKIKTFTTPVALKILELEYENAVTGRKVLTTNSSVNAGSKPLDITLSYGSTIYITTDYGISEISYNDILTQTTNMVTDPTNVDYTFTADGINFSLNISFVDCPVITYDDVCAKGIDLNIIESLGFTNTPIILNITYTDSFNNISTINDVFSGNSYNIEDDHTMVTSFDDNITISINNSIETLTKTFKLKDYLNYAQIQVGVYSMITLEIKTNLVIRLKIRTIDCVQCVDLDSVSEKLIGDKYYVEFSDGVSLTTVVGFPDCCPSNSIPIQTSGGYNCYLRDNMTDDCSEVLAEISSGTIMAINHLINIDGAEVAINATLSSGENINNNKYFIAPDTGKYKITLSGYGRHEVRDNNTKEIKYEAANLGIYINDVRQTSYTYYLDVYDSNTDTTIPPYNNTRTLELNAGDRVEFRNVYYVPTDTTYQRARVVNGTFKVNKSEVICGCEVSVNVSHTLVSTGFTDVSYRPKYENTTVTIDNGGNDVVSFVISLTNGATTTTPENVRIKNDSIISFTNVDKIDGYNSALTIEGNIVTTSGYELMKMNSEYLSLVFLSESSTHLIKFKFIPVDCDPIDLTFDYNEKQFIYYEDTFNSIGRTYTVKSSKDTILEIEFDYSNSNTLGGGKTSFFWNNIGKVYSYNANNELVEVTTNGETTTLPSVGCNQNGEMFINKKYRWIIPAGEHNFNIYGEGDSTYCNNRQEMSICSYGDNESGNSKPFFNFLGVFVYEVIDNVLIQRYNNEIQSTFYCGINTSESGGIGN